MKIKNIILESNLILAPMADYTDSAFRGICKEFGAALTVTEMISANALLYNNVKTLKLLETDKSENVVAVQLFGSDPLVMASACKHKALDKFDIIDINMGCPVSKITKANQGSSLMKDMNLANRIIKECVKSTSKPITVKFRSGWDDNSVNAVKFAKMCENAGASAICIHGRTRDQQYSGKSDMEIIRLVKKSVDIPVIGNGDVFDLEGYKRMVEYTGVDAVMIGRGCIGNPFIFSEILGKKYTINYIEVIFKHIDKLLEINDNRRIVAIKMRKHLAHYMKGIKNANHYKRKIFITENIDEMKSIIKEAFDQE